MHRKRKQAVKMHNEAKWDGVKVEVEESRSGQSKEVGEGAGNMLVKEVKALRREVEGLKKQVKELRKEDDMVDIGMNWLKEIANLWHLVWRLADVRMVW